MSSRREKRLKYKRQIEHDRVYPALRSKRDGKYYGYINVDGEFLIKPKYLSAYDFNKEVAIVQFDDKWGLISESGEYIVEPIYDGIRQFKENRAIFSLNNYMGVIDEGGKIITSKKYNFISDFKNNRAIVGLNSNDGNYKYGYIDLYGNEVIPIIYSEANSFDEGVALVRNENKIYSLIDKNGKIIKEYDYPYVSQYGNELMVFRKSDDGLSGYINEWGIEIISPKYMIAEGFKDNVAVVSESEKYNGPYGLIDKSGKYIYEPIFSNIKILGENRVALGMNIGKDDIVNRSIYSIADTNGRKLTDFIYLDVGEYVNDVAYASNESETFFIDKNGKIDKMLPIVSGSGSLTMKNSIVYANIDYYPYYLSKLGKVIYKPNNIIKLSKIYSVDRDKYKPNINYLMYYPIIKGIKSKEVQLKINNKLKKISYFEPYGEAEKKENKAITEQDVLDYDYYGDFDIKYFKNNLLTLNLTGYYYPVGAAHGMSFMKTPSIDLVTGKFYTIGDLFISSANWIEELNKIIKNTIETDPKYEYVFKDQFKGISLNQDFYIDNNNIYVYFAPYEIGPYAAGFITFKIPFSEVDKIINKNGGMI